MNHLKLEKRLLALAVGAALASAAGTASAFAPVWNTVSKKTDADVEVWHAGATASTSSLQKAVVDAFCDTASDVDILEDARTLGKPSFWAVACVGKATLPASLAGKKLLWNKRDDGGSGVGVGPVALGSAVGFMMPSTGAGNNCPSQNGGTRAVGSATAKIWNCTNFNYSSTPPVVAAVVDDTQANSDAVLRAPVIGTSDIEPDKFIFPENIPAADFDMDGNDGPALPSYETTGLTAQSVAQLVFGVPVNLLMYQDLQRAQFPAGHPLFNDCNPAGASYDTNANGSIKDKSDNANLEKCMPSLTGQEIRSIFAKSGAIRSAKDFQIESPYKSGTYVEMSATGATDNTIQIIRRVKGSGTQAQFNAIMLGYPCDATSDGIVDTLTPEGESLFTSFVSENEGSGDVEKALNDYNNGTNTSGKNSGLRKRWAIGLQSLEKNDSLSNDYRFIKIDGFAPTLLNVHAGDYYDVAAQSIQYKASGAATTTVDAYNTLVPFMQDPVNLAGLNKTHAFGVSGWLAAPANTPAVNKPDAKLDFTRPVSWFQRVSATGKGNTCALPSAFKKTGGTGVDITANPQNCSANGGADQNCYTGPN